MRTLSLIESKIRSTKAHLEIVLKSKDKFWEARLLREIEELQVEREALEREYARLNEIDKGINL